MEKVQRLLSDTAVNINSQTKMVRLFTQCCMYLGRMSTILLQSFVLVSVLRKYVGNEVAWFAAFPCNSIQLCMPFVCSL